MLPKAVKHLPSYPLGQHVQERIGIDGISVDRDLNFVFVVLGSHDPRTTFLIYVLYLT